MTFVKKISVLILFAGTFWYWYVYSNYIKNDSIKFDRVLFKNIYLNTDNLNSSIVSFNSQLDISTFKISWICDVNSDFLYSKNDKYLFKVKVIDENCKNNNFYLKNWEKIVPKTMFNLNFISEYDLFNKYTDYSDLYLDNFQINTKNKLFWDLEIKEINYSWSLNNIKKSRENQELIYNNNIVLNLLEKRQQKYLIPVNWYKLPTSKTKLPNSPRPYRTWYTDGIHNGWDIDAPKWTPVVSIDDWIIVNVISDFKFSDLNKLKRNWNISYEDKIYNLDILRWNQVWIKTTKWDVIFYAHLDEVFENIKVWNFVKRWENLWTIWISWVPDLNYTDYHLHFEVKKNPYIIKKAWKNTFDDFLRWDWYFKTEKESYIKEHQYDIFE